MNRHGIPALEAQCPAWCEDSNRPDHWDYPGKLWQTIHARKFGPFVVYVPQEIHDDGEHWTGHAEVHTDETDVVVYSATGALELAAKLQAAARFAWEQDQLLEQVTR